MWFVASMVAFAQSPADTAPPQGSYAPDPWVSQWYAVPRVNGRLIGVNGRQTLQGIGGFEVGLRYDHAQIGEKDGRPRRLARDLVGRTRFQGDVLYGLVSQSSGYGARLGSFIGPSSKVVTYQIGPDLWANQYGSEEGPDYHLPFSLGIDLMNLVIFQLDPAITAQVGIIPGWAFAGRRQTGRIGPFHEVSGFAMVSVRTQGLSFNLGYQRQYNAAGVFDGVILSGGL